MKFMPGEKVLNNGKPYTIINKHPTKNAYWCKSETIKGWWFDEKDLVKIEIASDQSSISGKKLAHERNANNKRKQMNRGIKRDFLCLTDS